MKKIYLLLFLCIILFPFTASAEQHSPTIEKQKEQENSTSFIFQMENYEEYLQQYKASQTTETTIALPSEKDITISTKGVFRIYNAAVLSPEYIKIKEQKAGSLKKGDCIYFELNKGRFLKDISAIITQGDMKATAVGNGSYIKLEITQTSTVPSEIILNRIMILPEGKNENSEAKSEFVLSLTSKYINGDNLFHNTKNVILNNRFATMEWYDGEYCYEGFRFEGRLLFANGISYCILNDNIIFLYHDTYLKQNYLMVPLRSLYHVFIVDNHYCETYVLNPSISVFRLNWDTEQKIATIGDADYYSVSFQDKSNTMTVIRAYRKQNSIIELPVAAEIKNDTIYVPLCAETVGAILRWDISKYMYWDDTAKTMLIEH
ncbi:hypothetical protein [Clostridium sp. MD294]|uniref:hypothetical protein n=1 Tax=Clostridium sp. MD294 TaxID=97138 RepID=UPI0002CA1283|nr:hypothetical protein [Clostridium sp. MD294]NDO46049.1 hypothetical protein [Clostridium sp. MD294]USF30287.1 hypothetical protein C820_001728 [Clostridium sp. MD294]